MDQPICPQPTRVRRAWRGLRNFYRAWLELRERRYRYLAEVLGEASPRPEPRQCPCRHL